jgi:hypothetical protein
VKEVHGTVLRYLLNPRGEVDGLLLEDGTFIKFPPHLGRDLVQVAKPNDEVIIIGPLEGRKLLRGHVVVNPKAEIALREMKPIPPERASFVGPLQPLRAEGTIRYAKHNPRGEIGGMAVGIGASLSNLLGGDVVERMGYRAGFVTMAGIAAVALIVFWMAMPETKTQQAISTA